MMQAHLLKMLDATLGRLLMFVWPNVRKVPVPEQPTSVLFVRPGGIGDAALLVPALDAFRELFPKCSIDVLAEKRNEKVFQMAKGLRDVFCYDKFADWLHIKARPYDVVIDTEQWYRLTLVFARLFGSKCTVGFGTNDRRRLLSRPIDYDLNLYEVFSFFSLLSVWKSVPMILHEEPFLKIPYEAKKSVERLLGQSAGKDFVAVLPGGSRPEKSWGVENFSALVKRLMKYKISYVVLGGNEDKTVAERLASEGGGISLAGKASLVESAGVVSKSRLLVANDTGLLHIATGLGVPTVGIYGPSNPEKWAAKVRSGRAVSRFVECAPCSSFGHLPKCRDGWVCLKSISVDDVFEQVRCICPDLIQ